MKKYTHKTSCPFSRSGRDGNAKCTCRSGAIGIPDDAKALNQVHLGSDFDDFLKKEGTYEEVHAEAVERVQTWVDGKPASTE